MKHELRKFHPMEMGVYALAALSLWGAGHAVMAATVSFAGTWVLQERTSLTGPDYSNGVPREIKITVGDKEIVIEKTGLDGTSDKESTVSEALALDGQPKISTTPSKRERVAQLTWRESKSEFLLTTCFTAPEKKEELEKSRTEHWQLSEDGATLVLVREEKSAKSPNDLNQNWSMKGEYALIRPGEMAGIRFVEPVNLQEALALAKRENKYLFVDCHATWCGPCKEMDRSVYPAVKVSDYVNQHFVSIKLQMDKTPKDDERIRRWYADADALNKEHVKGYPTYLFYSPDGKLVHKGMGMLKAKEFIALAGEALSPSSQYYTLLERYGARENLSPVELRILSNQARQFDNKDTAEKVAATYLDKVRARSLKPEDLQFLQAFPQAPKARALAAAYLKKMDDKALLTKQHLLFIDRFWGAEINSSHRLFKLFYRNAKAINEIQGNSGVDATLGSTAGWFTPDLGGDWAGKRLRRVILKEEITDKIYRDNKPVSEEPDWNAIKAAIHGKYGEIGTKVMILDAQIKFYYDAKQGAQYASYFAQKVDIIGPLALSMADNTIASIMLGYCDDRQILVKAIGWMETIIKDTEKKGRSSSGHMGNYAGLLYKAGRTDEAIKVLDGMKETNALSKDKLMILDRMKKGDKIDNSWDIAAFF